MTNKECCCTCYFGDLLDIDETICMYEYPDVSIVAPSYYWVCLHWKELNLWGYPSQTSNGFGLDYF
jgi:hypothetical protein